MGALRSGVASLGAVAALVTAAGCGSSSAPARAHSPAAGPGPAAAGSVSAHSVERALLDHGGPPRPTAAACRVSSAAERSASPFAPTRLALFTCELTVGGESASYVVQVLHDGCFVAERRLPGSAVYGCGAKGA